MATTNNTTNVQHTGKVKWFNGSRGFGFVTDLDSSTDIFVHHTGLVTSIECWRTLYEGEYIQYKTKQDKEGQDQAIEVTGIKAGPLLCETKHLQQQRNNNRNDRNDNNNTGGSTRPRFRPQYRTGYKKRNDRNDRNNSDTETRPPTSPTDDTE